jgi:uncharacterized protein YycO
MFFKGGKNITNNFVCYGLIISIIVIQASVTPIICGNTDTYFEGARRNRVPSYVQIGDILFCDIKPTIDKIGQRFKQLQIITTSGYSNDHVALYIGNNRFIESAPYLYRPLRKNWLGVVITPLRFINLWATNITYGSVINITLQERKAAVKWAFKQIGSPYQINCSHKNHNPNDPQDRLSHYWFCSELIWAAYYNQNIKIYTTWGDYLYNATYPGGLRIANNIKMYSNIGPTADAGGPYIGKVNEPVRFHGFNCTDIDGRIEYYHWDFGDGQTKTGWYVSHRYNKSGKYTVTLTVADNANSFDTDNATITIMQPNRAPSIPIFEGVKKGHTNTNYDYTLISYDPDNNDLQFRINWDDGDITTSNYIPNGSIYYVSHSWKSPGEYRILITVKDDEFMTQTDETVLIDIQYCGSIGYLVDQDSDGIYDMFYSNKTHTQLIVENQKEIYLLDIDDDNEWDYSFNINTTSLENINSHPTPGYEVFLLLLALIIIKKSVRYSKKKNENKTQDVRRLPNKNK